MTDGRTPERRKHKQLNDSIIRDLLPEEKQYRRKDGEGLYLVVLPTGSKSWRYDYMSKGKRKTAYLGVFPDITTTKARQLLREIKVSLSKGIDPQDEKRKTRDKIRQKQEYTVKAIAERWFEENKSTWKESTVEKYRSILNKEIVPVLGDTPLEDLDATQIFDFALTIKTRGAPTTAKKAIIILEQIFDKAIFDTACNCKYNFARDVARQKVLRHTVKHMAALTEQNQKEDIGKMLLEFENINSNFTVKVALTLAPYLFVRPSELVNAQWSEIDFYNSVWVIPATRMKKGREHRVPLASQVLNILRDLYEYRDSDVWVFSAPYGDKDVPISQSALRYHIHKSKYNKLVTLHGFRAMARTFIHESEELGFSPEAIEAQLAHKVNERLGEAYARTQFMKERTRMMQAWADFLDKLKAEAQQQRNGGNDEKGN